jgi:hypothetical protein
VKRRGDFLEVSSKSPEASSPESEEGEKYLQDSFTKILEGWPKLRDLTQHFDCKSLLEP